ncbi:MAG: class I SAM-dependent methyltransferase [bacterium]|nr:class I SAM-dependent methyltransferase [bacterium]
MQLSKRLKALTQLVTKGLRVADIGCDHAYVSIELCQKEIASKVIAMDINKGPLERAAANILMYGYEDRIETRLSNGAEKLQVGEVDALLIAGMGGALMKNILSSRQDVVDQLSELYLQPQSEVFLVRGYLREHGFVIEKETMLIDEGKYYVMMKAVRGVHTECSKVFDCYGKYLLEHKDPTLFEFLTHELAKKKKIVATLSEKYADRISELNEEIALIEGGLKFYAD